MADLMQEGKGVMEALQSTWRVLVWLRGMQTQPWSRSIHRASPGNPVPRA